MTEKSRLSGAQNIYMQDVPDLIGEIGGVRVIADFKTSNAPYCSTFPDRGDRIGFGGFRKYQKCAQQMAAYRLALEERTGYHCDVALIIVSTPETTQGIFIDSDQLDLMEGRFLKRCKQFHDNDKNDTESSSQQRAAGTRNPQKVAYDWLNISEDLEWLKAGLGAGYGWCATHFVDRHRKAENACGSTSLLLTLMVTQRWLNSGSTDTARHWCAATYTSLVTLSKSIAFVQSSRSLWSWSTVQSTRVLTGSSSNRLLAELSLESLPTTVDRNQSDCGMAILVLIVHQ